MFIESYVFASGLRLLRTSAYRPGSLTIPSFCSHYVYRILCLCFGLTAAEDERIQARFVDNSELLLPSKGVG
nr:MAG TPA: hypothetical protein [Caudoviricetes sp.]